MSFPRFYFHLSVVVLLPPKQMPPSFSPTCCILLTWPFRRVPALRAPPAPAQDQLSVVGFVRRHQSRKDT